MTKRFNPHAVPSHFVMEPERAIAIQRDASEASVRARAKFRARTAAQPEPKEPTDMRIPKQMAATPAETRTAKLTIAKTVLASPAVTAALKAGEITDEQLITASEQLTNRPELLSMLKSAGFDPLDLIKHGAKVEQLAQRTANMSLRDPRER